MLSLLWECFHHGPPWAAGKRSMYTCSPLCGYSHACLLLYKSVCLVIFRWGISVHRHVWRRWHVQCVSLYHYMYLWMYWCSVSWLFVRYANKYKVSVCTHLDVYHCVSGDCFCSLVYFMCLLWQRICATSVHLIPGKWDQSGGIRASKSECVDVYGLLCGTYLRVCGMSK